MELYLIRHGKTKGNEEGRYIGSTDDPLSEEGKRELTEVLWKNGWEEAGLKMPLAVYVSGLLRTRETAALLFPEVPFTIKRGLNECDFGEFENKNYEELKGNPAYTAWIDSGGTSAPPGGEAKADFAGRTFLAFEEAVSELLSQTRSEEAFAGPGLSAAFVVHGGSIMAILERYGLPKEGFYHWQAKNGCGYRAVLSGAAWQAGERNLTEIRSIP